LQKEINCYVFEDHRHDPDSIFEDRKARLLKIFEKALVQLDSEGVFGTGKKRHRVLLMIDRGDCGPDEIRYMHRVIRRINPRQSAARYFAALKKQKRNDAARLLREVRVAKRNRALATAFLRRIKRPIDRYRFTDRIEEDVPRLARLLPGKRKPGDLWEVWFESKKEPGGQMHAPGMLFVIVDPASGKCALGP
jgi:hypothetical protein